MRGVTQKRRGAISVESYYQHLLNPQALQFDSREDDLDLLYFSDSDTGYIYKVTGMGGYNAAASVVAAAIYCGGTLKARHPVAVKYFGC